jgi:tRNA U34 5-methylaminomethyl-2-thiouridine-forming methyltransferase MnmC
MDANPREKKLTDKNDPLSGFEVLAHANGTRTLVDRENGQAMHSRIGPEAEANRVYADRARIEERLIADDSTVVLYDVGMGIGANVLAVLERIREARQARGALKIYSFETKTDGLRLALAQVEDFPMLAPWKNELRGLLETGESRTRIGEVEIDWKLVVGDFYSAILAPIPPPDFVFFDFYSPKVVPELWSREKFEVLRRKIGDRDARLYTYSAATPVRLHLLLAGFFVGEGISTGVKNETTIAATRLESLERPLSRSWLTKLDTSASIADSPWKEAARAHPQWALEK